VGGWDRPAHRTEGPTHLEGVLLETADQRYLALVLGPVDAAGLALLLVEAQTPRPLTHSFCAALLRDSGAEVERVVIESLIGDTYHARVYLRNGPPEGTDARPSDALGLALACGAPIFISQQVLRVGGMPREQWKPEWLSEHARDIARNSGRFWRSSMTSEAKSPRSRAERVLTERQQQVLQLVAAGHTNVEVGRTLGLSPYTVTRHLANVYERLGVSRRAQAVAFLAR
jgi:bifunctional DNase/RNase/DNA-binding CsgD family transcriptional regulator